MGTTSNFLKKRSSSAPKLGIWNKNYKSALDLAKKQYKFIITCWSNGDKCGSCIATEECMLQKSFITWMTSADAYFVFQYSGDKDKGQTLYNWIFNAGKIKWFPGFRITLWSKDGKKIISDTYVDGDTLRGKETKDAGAKKMIAALKKILASKPEEPKPQPAPDPTPAPVATDYVVRLNEGLTTAQVNKVLDAIDKNGGYCPCQAKANGTKCHCEDFVKNKDYGVPCICKIYVKQKPVAK